MGAAALRDKSGSESSELLGGGVPFAGKYAVERILGIGGMGTVFEARHIRLGHRVAIKVLGSELRDYPELVTRFEREARAAGSLSSRHAVRVFDIDMTEDATPFIVMELLSGQDLARIVERDGAQPVERAVRWVIEACDAIGEAHRLGIIHRDVKPSNLFLTDEGVKVLDFGIAKRVAAKEVSITHAVAPLGTPQYMSPEQVRCAKDVDARTDVWSLGVTLYELVTGKTPFAHEIPQACIASIAADPVPDPRTIRPDLPAAFVDVVMKALRKDPTQRWGSVPDLVEALAPHAGLDFDGDEPSTAVRRVIDDARRVSRADDNTLDGESRPSDLFESGVRASVRPLTDSGVPIPPTVTKIPAPTRARFRSRLALAGAAVLGIAALVITPKCVARFDTNAPATATVHAHDAVVPIETVAPAQAAEPAHPAQKVEPAVEIVEAHALEQPQAAKELTPAAAALKKPKPASPKAPRTGPTTRPTSYGDSPVHGGLSSPGF